MATPKKDNYVYTCGKHIRRTFDQISEWQVDTRLDSSTCHDPGVKEHGEPRTRPTLTGKSLCSLDSSRFPLHLYLI